MKDGTRVRIKASGKTGEINRTMMCGDVIVLLDESGLLRRYFFLDVEPLEDLEVPDTEQVNRSEAMKKTFGLVYGKQEEQ